MQIIVYSSHFSSRLKYILDVILNERLGLNYGLTNNKVDAINSKLPVICYDDEKIAGSIHIIPNKLLFERKIEAQQIKFEQQQSRWLLFLNESETGFDIFAATFYLITRYEEYLPFKGDKFGRFTVSESLMGKQNLVREPLIDIWIYDFALLLKERFSSLNIKKIAYNQQVTVDIDMFFSYICKPFPRLMGGFAKDLLSLKWNSLIKRLLTNFGISKDPFDFFDFLQEIHFENYKPIFFIAAGSYGNQDTANPLYCKRVQQKIEKCKQIGIIGLHPSFHSHQNNELLISEKEELALYSQQVPRLSRQHFLMLSIPNTYRNLIQQGFTNDYSLGYAEEPGFRAATASSFLFYDLLHEETTNLRIHPFVTMDRTYISYKNMKAADSLIDMLELKNKVKQYGGTFISLWHNITLSQTPEGCKWRQVFHQFIQA
jgi:hypothetical protein